MTQELSIDIWSDVMCPWCLVGWGGLQQALDQLDGEIDAQIRWHPFELNPDMPAEGEERTAHIARKYGRTMEQSRGVQDQMREAAQQARHPWPGNTRELENVIHFALLVNDGEEILADDLDLPDPER